MIASVLKIFFSFVSYCVKQKIGCFEIRSGDQLCHIGVVAAGKPAVRCEHDDCLLFGWLRLQIRMVDRSGFGQHGSHGRVHLIEIRLGTFRARLRLLQLYR